MPGCIMGKSHTGGGSVMIWVDLYLKDNKSILDFCFYFNIKIPVFNASLTFVTFTSTAL